MRCKCYYLRCTNGVCSGLFHHVKGGREDRPGAVFCEVICAYDPCCIQIDTILLVKCIAERTVRKIETVGVVGGVANTGDIGWKSSVVDDAT